MGEGEDASHSEIRKKKNKISDEKIKYTSIELVRYIVSKIVFIWRQHSGTNNVIYIKWYIYSAARNYQLLSMLDFSFQSAEIENRVLGKEPWFPKKDFYEPLNSSVKIIRIKLFCFLGIRMRSQISGYGYIQLHVIKNIWKIRQRRRKNYSSTTEILSLCLIVSA